MRLVGLGEFESPRLSALPPQGSVYCQFHHRPWCCEKGSHLRRSALQADALLLSYHSLNVIIKFSKNECQLKLKEPTLFSAEVRLFYPTAMIRSKQTKSHAPLEEETMPLQGKVRISDILPHRIDADDLHCSGAGIHR